MASTVTSSVPPPGGRAAFPERLDVDVTAKHLTEGSRTRPGDSPLALALHDALGAAGIPFTRIEATDASFRIYHSHPQAHDARYAIPDDSWKLVARHAAGRRVKPCTVTLEAVYRRQDVRA